MTAILLGKIKLNLFSFLSFFLRGEDVCKRTEKLQKDRCDNKVILTSELKLSSYDLNVHEDSECGTFVLRIWSNSFS